MKAMIFAAGIGSRLKPWTDHHPKALVEVGGKPMLGRVIESLKKAGVTEIVVNVHHFADQIESFLSQNGNFGVEINISDERKHLLDTGGGLLKAATMLDYDEPVILHNADVFTDVDFSRMLRCHADSHADATLLVSGRKSSRAFLFDNSLRLRGWKNFSDGNTLPSSLPDIPLSAKAFGGIHIITRKVLETLAVYNPGTPFSITPFYAVTSSSLLIRGYEPRIAYKWYDVGRPENLALARECAKSRGE